MSDNIETYDKNRNPKIIRAKEINGILFPWYMLSDGTDSVEIQTGAVNGEKGLRVFIGPTDPISDLPVIVDLEHHQLHEGETYKAIEAQSSLGTGTVKYEITVPTIATTIRCPHMVVACDIYDGAARVDVYENPDAPTGGSSMTALNRNRNSANTPAATIKTGVTITGGTLIESFYVGSGTRSASGARTGAEWILKSNETYRVDVVGLSASTKAIVHFDWYEDKGV